MVMEEDLNQDCPLRIADVSSSLDQVSQTRTIRKFSITPPCDLDKKDTSLLWEALTPELDKEAIEVEVLPVFDTMNYVSRQEERSERGEIYNYQNSDDACKHVSWQLLETPENGDAERNGYPLEDFPLGSMLAFSGSSTDHSFRRTPDFITKTGPRTNALTSSVELSLENGIGDQGLPVSTEDLDPEMVETGSVEASFDLAIKRDEFSLTHAPVLSINVGENDRTLVLNGVDFQGDSFFTGGEVIKTGANVGNGEDAALYQTARYGNFSYSFQNLECGLYLVDLHLAEIIFTEGPPGMRVFDVFIQEEKVVSGLDIYAQVGSNQRLILYNLQAFVNDKGGLSIRFQGVIGPAILCGISIRKDSSLGNQYQMSRTPNTFSIQGKELESYEMDDQEGCKGCDCKAKVWKLQKDYTLLYKDQLITKRALIEAEKESELKRKECYEAWSSLHDLQNELMRKSMHVGSLAYAVEGQVKEKTRWFSSLQDLSEKFKTLKTQHQTLSEEALECKKCLADVTYINATIQSTLTRQVDLNKKYEDLKFKYIEGAKERKELYNKLLDLKGNIRVFCRCRPLNSQEIADGASTAVDLESAKEGELVVKSNGGLKKVFKFDAVFSPQADQANVFEDTAPFATSVLDGYNVCIFAYGQTGTGKTFTMEGTKEARGVNYRTLEELFRIINERKGVYTYEISVSVLEVYNEQIRDLLMPNSEPGVAAKKLEIRQVAEGIHHVPGLVEANVNNMNEVWEVLKTGSNARTVNSTNANKHSSRSHCIYCVMVKGHNLISEECISSKLWLVDLAGSERITKTEVQGESLKEAQNINRSLSALGDVIYALSNKSSHIPFRNSKLTHLLQDSLGGDSKTLMFVQISPNENDINETLCSLNFASRVKGIELGAAKKQVDVGELFRYKQMIEKAKQDIRCKDDQIKRMEEVVNNLESKMKGRDTSNKSLQEKVKELESQLLIERRLARQHIDAKIVEQQQQQQQQQKDQHQTSMKPPLSAKQFGNNKQAVEQSSTLFKDVVNAIRPLADYNITKLQLPPTSGSLLNYKSIQKENKPDVAEETTSFTRSKGRASICTTARRISVTPMPPRRNSLIPMLTSPSIARLPPTLRPIGTSLPPPLPRPVHEADTIKKDTDVSENISELTPWSSKVVPRSAKINNILRRSIQKKVYIKSPLPPPRHNDGRTGALGGIERVRVSFGSQGRMTQRILVSNNYSKGGKHYMQKEKGRGWNHGTPKNFL